MNVFEKARLYAEALEKVYEFLEMKIENIEQDKQWNIERKEENEKAHNENRAEDEPPYIDTYRDNEIAECEKKIEVYKDIIKKLEKML